jgi:hypothetical protein
MREARQVKLPLQLQVAHPPDWLPDAHSSADLGASTFPSEKCTNTTDVSAI